MTEEATSPPEMLSVEEAVAQVQNVANYKVLEELSPTYRDNPTVVSAAVRVHPAALLYASDRLKNDINIVLKAIACDRHRKGGRKYGWLLGNISPEWKNDRAHCRRVIDVCGCDGLAHLPQHFQQDRELALAAFLFHPHEGFHNDNQYTGSGFTGVFFQYGRMTDSFGRDKEVMCAALENLGDDGDKDLLRYASEELRADPDVVRAGLKHHPTSLRHAAPVLREDPDMQLYMLTRYQAQTYDPYYNLDVILQHLNVSLTSREVVMAAKLGLQFASPNLRNDREVVMAAIEDAGGLILRFASPELRNDREVVLAALRAPFRGECDDDYPGDILYDKEHECVLQYASSVLRDDREIVAVAMQHHVPNYFFCPDSLRVDPTIVSIILHQRAYEERYFLDAYEGSQFEQMMIKWITTFAMRDEDDGPSWLERCDGQLDSVVDQWSKDAWEKVWLIQQLVPERGIAKLIVCYSDVVATDFAEVSSTLQLIPIFQAAIDITRENADETATGLLRTVFLPWEMDLSLSSDDSDDDESLEDGSFWDNDIIKELEDLMLADSKPDS